MFSDTAVQLGLSEGRLFTSYMLSFTCVLIHTCLTNLKR